MNKQREIINDKLNSIDHKLDVDQLWRQLEPNLPPTTSTKKRPLFWFWSGMLVGLFAIGILSWMYLSHDAKSDTRTDNFSASSIASEQRYALATREDAKVPESQNKAIVAAESEVNSKPIETKELAAKQSAAASTPIKKGKAEGLPQYSTTVADQSKSAASNIATSKEKTTKRSTSKAREMASHSLPTNIKVQEIVNKKLEPSLGEMLKVDPQSKSAEAAKTTHDSTNDNQVNTSQKSTPKLAFATIASLTAEVNYVRAVPQYEHLAEYSRLLVTPRPAPSRWSVEALYNYGQSFGTASYSENDRDINVTEGEPSRNPEHVDIMGADLRIGYRVTSRWGLTAGVSYTRLTDKISKTETRGTDIESIADLDGGYKISNSIYLATAYDRSTVIDLNVGVKYNFTWGKLGFQPELGMALGLSHERVKKMIDGPLENYQLLESAALEYASVVSNERINTNYYMRLAADYAVSNNLDLVASIKYLPARTFKDVSATDLQLNSMALAQLGLRYRF